MDYLAPYDAIPDGVFVLSSDFKVRFWNRAMERFTGHGRAEMVGRSAFERYPKLGAPRYRPRLEQVFEGAPPIVFSMQLHPHLIPSRLPDGRLRVHQTVVTALEDPERAGQRLAVFNVQDMNETVRQVAAYRKMKELALREVEERQKAEQEHLELLRWNRALLRALPDLIFTFDMDGRYLSFSGSEDKLLAPPERLIGSTLREVAALPDNSFTEADGERFMAALALAAKGEVKAVEYEVEVGGGEALAFEARLSKLDEEQVVAIVREVTDKKRYEQKLEAAREKAEAASQAKSEFLSNMSHEIRTPLNAVIGYANLLLEERQGDEMVMDAMRTVRHSAENLLRILNDILDLSKVEAGKMTLANERFDLREQVEAVFRSFALSADRKGLDYRLRFSPEAPTVVQSDPLRVSQILYNLLGNAIKFTKEGFVSLEVKVERQGPDEQSALTFEVSDTGMGIPEDKLESIFESFEQVQGQASRKHGGTGLGLAIVRRLAERFGGTVSVESARGRGARFSVRLPLEAFAVTKRPAEAARPAVLLLEPNPAMRIVLAKALESGGEFEALAVPTASEALTALAERPLALLVASLPEPSATMEFVERARRSRSKSELPILLLCDEDTEEAEERAVRLGADATLPKASARRTLAAAARYWAKAVK